MNLEEESSNLRSQLEISAEKSLQAKNSETNFKKQVDELKQQIRSLESDLGDASSQKMSNDSQHRSEVPTS